MNYVLEDVMLACVVSVLQVRNIPNCTLSRSCLASLVEKLKSELICYKIKRLEYYLDKLMSFILYFNFKILFYFITGQFALVFKQS